MSVSCISSKIWNNPYSGQIRLVGGSTVNQGLVEVYCSGQWGTVCDNGFSQTDADTVCRQLGYHSAFRFNHLSNRGRTDQPILLDHVPCDSAQSCIANCINCPSNANSCFHYEDVTIECHSPTVYTETNINTCRDMNNRIGNTLAGAIVGSIFGLIFTIAVVLIIGNTIRENKRLRGSWCRFRSARQSSDDSGIQLSDPTITEAPPPAYSLHENFAIYNEQNETDLPPSYTSIYLLSTNSSHTSPEPSEPTPNQPYEHGDASPSSNVPSSP